MNAHTIIHIFIGYILLITHVAVAQVPSSTTCRNGFTRIGSECVSVQIPENAKLNVYGNDWVSEFYNSRSSLLVR